MSGRDLKKKVSGNKYTIIFSKTDNTSSKIRNNLKERFFLHEYIDVTSYSL